MKPKILLLIFFILSIPVIFPFLNQHAVANLSTISFATVAKYNPPDITTLPGVYFECLPDGSCWGCNGTQSTCMIIVTGGGSVKLPNGQYCDKVTLDPNGQNIVRTNVVVDSIISMPNGKKVRYHSVR
ncbi:MAG: hypothetical protein H0V65_02150 [Chitinophagales bacterium]|jgi:hypothetical protein|nr:hypothetical protein [Chitinophagales bacterium]